MNDQEVLEHITKLVDEEHGLRAKVGTGVALDDTARERMQQIEVQLDQCWDLLRRREAREEFGQDPDTEHVQPANVVENYRQ